MAVVVLSALTPAGTNLTLKTLWAASSIGGMRFMAVENERDQTVPAWPKRLGSFEAPVELSIDFPSALVVHASTDAADRVIARKTTAQPVGPKATGARLVESVEAPQTGQEHNYDALDHSGGLDTRAGTRVGNLSDSLGEAKDLLGVGKNPTKDR
jgi:hypothetical protein